MLTQLEKMAEERHGWKYFIYGTMLQKEYKGLSQ